MKEMKSLHQSKILERKSKMKTLKEAYDKDKREIIESAIVLADVKRFSLASLKVENVCLQKGDSDTSHRCLDVGHRYKDRQRMLELAVLDLVDQHADEVVNRAVTLLLDSIGEDVSDVQNDFKKARTALENNGEKSDTEEGGETDV